MMKGTGRIRTALDRRAREIVSGRDADGPRMQYRGTENASRHY
jgi:hypothetical protein